MTPHFGAIAQRRITILPAPLQSHIKTANQARAVIGRLEYALQHDRREDAHALALNRARLVSAECGQPEAPGLLVQVAE